MKIQGSVEVKVLAIQAWRPEFHPYVVDEEPAPLIHTHMHIAIVSSSTHLELYLLGLVHFSFMNSFEKSLKIPHFK